MISQQPPVNQPALASLVENPGQQRHATNDVAELPAAGSGVSTQDAPIGFESDDRKQVREMLSKGDLSPDESRVLQGLLNRLPEWEYSSAVAEMTPEQTDAYLRSLDSEQLKRFVVEGGERLAPQVMARIMSRVAQTCSPGEVQMLATALRGTAGLQQLVDGVIRDGDGNVLAALAARLVAYKDGEGIDGKALAAIADRLVRRYPEDLKKFMSGLSPEQSARMLNAVASSNDSPSNKRVLLSRMAEHVAPQSLAAMGANLSGSATALMLLGARDVGSGLLGKLIDHLPASVLQSAFHAIGSGKGADGVVLFEGSPRNPANPLRELEALLGSLAANEFSADTKAKAFAAGVALLKAQHPAAASERPPAELTPILMSLQAILKSDPYGIVRSSVRQGDSSGGYDAGDIKFFSVMMVKTGHGKELAELTDKFVREVKNDLGNIGASPDGMQAKRLALSALGSFFGALTSAQKQVEQMEDADARKAWAIVIDAAGFASEVPGINVAAIPAAIVLTALGYIVEGVISIELNNIQDPADADAVLSSMMSEQDWALFRDAYQAAYARAERAG